MGHVHSETRVDVVCESCQAPIDVACSCAEGTPTSDSTTPDASETRVDVVCESCQAPVGVSCTCADVTRVPRYPALRHHAMCEPRALGSSLPTVTSRGLTCGSDRHAGRSEGLP